MAGGWAEEWSPSHCLAQTETPRHAEPAVVLWSSLARRLALQAMARWLNKNCLPAANLAAGPWEEEWQIERRQCSPGHRCDMSRGSRVREMLGDKRVPGVGSVKLRDVLMAFKIIKWALYEFPLALQLKLGNSQMCIC